MKKRLYLITILLVGIISLSGCSNSSKVGKQDSTTEETTEDVTESDSSYDDSSDDTSEEADEEDTDEDTLIEHYCAVDGCYEEGEYEVEGFSGEIEYYCKEHYDEMQDTINMMEEDVGNGSASEHKCEQCDREGTHEVEGFSGETEYYCTEHYNKIIDNLEKIYGN